MRPPVNIFHILTLYCRKSNKECSTSKTGAKSPCPMCHLTAEGITLCLSALGSMRARNLDMVSGTYLFLIVYTFCCAAGYCGLAITGFAF